MQEIPSSILGSGLYNFFYFNKLPILRYKKFALYLRSNFDAEVNTEEVQLHVGRAKFRSFRKTSRRSQSCAQVRIDAVTQMGRGVIDLGLWSGHLSSFILSFLIFLSFLSLNWVLLGCTELW